MIMSPVVPVTMASPSLSAATVAPWVLRCSQMAPWAAIALFLAPMPTIWQISKDKSVGQLPLLPYSSMSMSCLLWVTYGLLKKEPSIILANGTGLVLGLYYFTAFVRYAPLQSPTLPGAKWQHVRWTAAVALWCGLAGLWSSSWPAVATWVGRGGVVLNVALFASPLAALKVVLQTQSARPIPWSFTLASIVNCVLWSVSGWLHMHDFNIYAPNLLGLMFGLAQLALKLWFGDGPKHLRGGGGGGTVCLDLPM